MIKLVRKPDYEPGTDRLVEACKNAGYEVSHEDAQWAWEEYSDSMCAGWLGIDEEQKFGMDIVEILLRYLQPESK
jgi:hypothetical protein